MDPNAFGDPHVFEEEVRRIARQLWPSARGGGAMTLDERERDGIFETEECIHVMECTVSRSKDKATKDAGKLRALIPQLRKKNPTKAVKGWFITLHEPTGEQRAVVNQAGNDIATVSYDTFRAKLIDAKSYLEARTKYAFGSVRDPTTGGVSSKEEYVKMELLGDDRISYTTSTMAKSLLGGSKFVFLGDYGAGKSMNFREIFLELRRMYLKNQTNRFPILINLRDHHGQTNPAEALERHARNIGYTTPSHLVRAWLAGYVVLMLDGFDEMGSSGWVGKVKKLRELRYNSTALLRDFIRQNPGGAGMAVSGRAHYFDGEDEMVKALGFPLGVTKIRLNDFNEEQIQRYLEGKGWKGSIPSWFPSRPLLLGYLASKDMLGDMASLAEDVDPATGWDILLTKVSYRESDIEIGIDGDTVRKIIERLASQARVFEQGLGPLTQEMIVAAFKEECGYEPDDKGLVLLQRLPGLGIADSQDGSRQFIDSDLVDVARAGDVCRFISNPFAIEIPHIDDWHCAMGTLGRDVVVATCARECLSAKQVSASLERSAGIIGAYVLSWDILHVMMQLGLSYDGKPIQIEDVVIRELEIDTNIGNLRSVSMKDCFVQDLGLSEDIDKDRMPRFTSCLFSSVDGRVSKADMPMGVFDDTCVFEAFGSATETTAAILDIGLSLPVRVCLSAMKKLYFQAGTGRKHSALLRGLDHKAQRLVPDVLQVMRQAGLVIENARSRETVWLPVRRNTDRVRKLLATPVASGDPMIERLNRMG